MHEAPNAAEISVAETLSLLDGDFKSFADGVAEGRYAFWLGSGISLFRFPGLKVLVEQVLEFLRESVDRENPDCPFKGALERAFTIAALSAPVKRSIDLGVPVSDWHTIENLKESLASRYSTLLNIDIDGQENDYLVWDGVRVAEVYGDPTVDPDAEHLMLAVLVREGLVDELASANWDGLIEKAIQQISSGACPIDVCVRSEDLQSAVNRAKLVKFHGCAVRAQENEKKFRPYIVGRLSQVDSWPQDSKMQGLIEHLRSVIIERPTLMLGFSAQDFNIRSLFGAASTLLKWQWPGDRPAYVFSEDVISEGQRALLQNVYREQYQGECRAKIIRGAHLKAFAKPLLGALVVYALGEKLTKLSHFSRGPNTPEFRDWIATGIKHLRNLIAETDDGNHHGFILNFISQVSRAKSLFVVGQPPTDPTSYEPLYAGSVSQIVESLELRQSGMAEGAVVAGVLGAGAIAGEWNLESEDVLESKAGQAVVVTPDQSVRLFILASAQAENALFANGQVDESDDVILIHAQPLYDRMQRSPIRELGRTGVPRPRRTSIRTLLDETNAPEAFMERFRMELAI